MPKIMEIIAKETRGTSYNTFKYSFDSIGSASRMEVTAVLFP